MKGPFSFLSGCYLLLASSEYDLSTWETHYTAGTVQNGDARPRADRQDGQVSGCTIPHVDRHCAIWAQCDSQVAIPQLKKFSLKPKPSMSDL